MLASLLRTHYDPYHPDSAHTLVNSVRSFINSKLDYERRTTEFINEIRRILYFIHEYNCEVVKATHKYPKSRKFDLLLVKYVELEFDALYHNNTRPSRQLESATELRVLRLLHVMLYQAVLNNEPLISGNTDAVLKRAVLQILGEVGSAYLVKNKLVCNIANKLLKVDGASNSRSIWEIHKNIATSDYGTDDNDSDFEPDILHKDFNANKQVKHEKKDKLSSDCVEVLLTADGVTPVPTIEFTDDDDENYFVYLQKRVTVKRKIKDDCKTVHTKKNSSNSVSNKDLQFNVNSKNSKDKCISSENSDTINDKTSATEQRTELCAISNNNDSCVVICSDSEDEVSEVDLNNSARVVKKNRKNAEDECNKKAKIDKNIGVVTFEILDDDDNGEANYMVYLQKEVETNKKPKKHKKIHTEEVIICSDSEDDTVVEVVEKGSANTDPAQKISQDTISTTHFDHIVPQTESEEKLVSKNCTLNTGETSFDETLDDILKLVTTIPSENNSESCSSSDCNTELKVSQSNELLLMPEVAKQHTGNQLLDSHNVTSASEVNTNLLVLRSEIGLTVSENSNPSFLVDPAVVFEQNAQLFMNDGLPLKLSGSYKNQGGASTSKDGGPNVLGGPILSEKVGTPEDLDNLQECRINESLLEELLLDDSYLLEGRKEFEELEYFLFHDNTEKPGFHLSNFSFDEDENILQPETFDADMNSLESLLDDSQLFTLGNLKDGEAGNNMNDSLITNKTSKYGHKKKIDENVYCNPLKDSTNKNLRLEDNLNDVSANTDVKKNTKGFSSRKSKNFRTIFKQSRKLAKR